jgi:hypothetical protein
VGPSPVAPAASSEGGVASPSLAFSVEQLEAMLAQAKARQAEDAA